MRLPPLNTLRIFDVAARTLSFVKAAEELHVTHGAVSRQIRQLEEALGVELFQRRNRAVFLTDAGLALQAATSAAFAQLITAIGKLQSDEAGNVIVVSCEPTIAMKWLIPRLPRFQQAYPELQVHLYAAGGPIDLVRAGVDVALRRNDFQWDETWDTWRVGEELVGPVCVPQLAPGAGPWQGKLLHTLSRPNSWANWAKATGHEIRATGRINYEHFYLCVQAAAAGIGAALASCYMVEEELAGSRLIAPCGFVPDGSAYYVLSPRRIQDDSRLLRFAEWITTEMAATRDKARAAAP